MFSLTRQEKSVLLFIASVTLAGITINYLQKIPRFKNSLNYITTQTNTFSKINLNKATLEELISLPGIGQELARRIIDYRASAGGIKTIEELKKVKGIGHNKFEALKDRINVDENLP